MLDDFMIEQQADEFIPDNYEEIQKILRKEIENAYSDSDISL